MSRMKHLLRKLHIGGGINEHQRLPDTRPAVPLSPTPNIGSSSSVLASGTMLPVAADELVADRTPIDGGGICGDEVLDFNLLEEEFQVQLALAISASDPDVRKDPETAQIDAAKQMSLGCAASVTDTEALVQFQSLRYWNYNVIDYEEKVMDGFYDAYGITSNLIERGMMPLLVDLQTTSVSKNVDYEVILVNRIVDNELQELEKRACILSTYCCPTTQGLLLSGLLQKLADIVVKRMGGPVGDADEMLKSWTMRSHELRNSLRTIVLPLGYLDVGLSRHRALLFKVLADRINVPCMLVKGSYYTGTDDGAVNLIRAEDGSEYIIDLMGAPGALIPAEVPSSQLQSYGLGVRGCADIVGLPENPHLMLDNRTSMLSVSSDLDRISKLARTQSEEPLNVGSQIRLDKRNPVGLNEADRFGNDLGSLLQSLHKSCESSSYTEASPAEKMQVKNVSNYVLSAAKNPDFAPKVHAVLLESGALPPLDLFSEINSQDKGEVKVTEKIHQVGKNMVDDTVQADPDKLAFSHERSVMPSQGASSGIGIKLCQPANWFAEQQKYLQRDAIKSYNSSQNEDTRNGSVMVYRTSELEQTDVKLTDRVPVNQIAMCDEQFLESSLPTGAVSCKKLTAVDLISGEAKKCLDNKVGAAFNDMVVNKASSIQSNETCDRDYALYDGKSEKVNPVLGEGNEWEIQWEDLRIGERIGIGSCGEVYRADLKGTEVAVKKFLDQDFSGDALAQFKSEVEIMLRLRHPNVVLFMGAIARPPNFSILTEYLPRGSLYRLLHRSNFQLDDKRRLCMALDVAKGMNYLHTSSPTIVHRDLKSPNLLVDNHWVVKVCDFGLSRMKHHTFLSSKSIAGTPEWMAPEVLRNEPANEKCDVYSFGVILWELATTRIPWKGLNPMQVVGAVGFRDKRLDIPEDVDPAVAQIIHDCWLTEPHLRPSFSQLISRLRRLQNLCVEKNAQHVDGSCV